LEIKQEMGDGDGEPSAVPAAAVEAAVTNYIYGGTNVIAGTAAHFSQIGNVVIAAGDFEALANALTGLNIPQKQIKELQGAIESDHKGFGERTKGWLKTVGKTGVKAGVAIGQEAVRDLLFQYFGLK
jgi:hypothetical protein